MLEGLSGSALAEGDLAPTPPSLARQYDPVVITGAFLSNLTGTLANEIFVYAYQDTAPIQIPFQIDERDGSGIYVPLEDGQLDDNDELVFMAVDGGGWVDNPLLDVGGTSITPIYVITLTDPISNTYAWAYVFRSGDVTDSVTADYVSYDSVNDRINSPGRYALGFEAFHGFMDYLTLGDGDRDLLDRSKLRISGTVEFFGSLFPFSRNEQDLTKDGVHVIDGPVRVTRVSTNTIDLGGGNVIQGIVTLFAYRSLTVLPETVAVPGYPVRIAYQRSSMDWNEQATGMTFYDANNPAGVTVDGMPDVITTTPLSRWSQASGVTGMVVSVNNIPAGLGATQSTYYKDDLTPDAGDTGDQRSYGDAGFQVYNPNPGTYTLLGHTYFLTDVMAKVGTTS